MAHTMITVAPTGAESSKADVPALPVTIDELVSTAQACEAAGAAMIHIHIRDAMAADPRPRPAERDRRCRPGVEQPRRPALDRWIGARRLRATAASAGRRT